MDMSTDNLDIMQFFVSMLIVGIGVALLATGMFTSYFGAGKSQKIGFALLATGTIIIALIYLMAFGGVDAVPNEFDENSLYLIIVLISKKLDVYISSPLGFPKFKSGNAN